ncbi:MAG: hypothetical protein HY231_21125 [Acidobacteria bacterium]|nr:hypothetical protein [Acidobacteriota bacterium]
MDNYLLKAQRRSRFSQLWLQPLALIVIIILSFSFVEAAHAQPTFVYSYNAHSSGPNKISGYSVAANGNVISIPGSPFLCNGGGPVGSSSPAPNRMVIAGNFLFASGGASINAFFINPQTGTLTPVQGSPFSTMVQGFIIGEGISLAVTPDRKYLFAGGADIGVIQTFSIALDGTLAPVKILPVNGARSGLRDIKVSPDGKFLAVGLNGSAISGRPFFMYKISGDGSLSLILGPFFTYGNGRATDMEFSCESNLLFVVGDTVTPIYTDVFNVSLEGYLSAIPGSPFVQRSGNFARGGQTTFLSPNGKLLFVNEAFGNKITVWSVASDGTLTIVPGSGFLSGGSQPERMVMDKEGKWLFIANLFGNDNLVHRNLNFQVF